VVVLRKNHRAVKDGKLSMEKLTALPHLDFSSVGYATDFVDRALAQRKLRRRIGLRAPFLSGERTLLSTDMIAIVRRRVAAQMVRNRPLAICPLPHPSPTIETAMIWLRRFDNHTAHRWLRDVVGKVCQDLRAE
jgi:DNA-binding transcriptional LysR family regulator